MKRRERKRERMSVWTKVLRCCLWGFFPSFVWFNVSLVAYLTGQWTMMPLYMSAVGVLVLGLPPAFHDVCLELGWVKVEKCVCGKTR